MKCSQRNQDAIVDALRNPFSVRVQQEQRILSWPVLQKPSTLDNNYLETATNSSLQDKIKTSTGLIIILNPNHDHCKAPDKMTGYIRWDMIEVEKLMSFPLHPSWKPPWSHEKACQHSIPKLHLVIARSPSVVSNAVHCTATQISVHSTQSYKLERIREVCFSTPMLGTVLKVEHPYFRLGFNIIDGLQHMRLTLSRCYMDSLPLCSISMLKHTHAYVTNMNTKTCCTCWRPPGLPEHCQVINCFPVSYSSILCRELILRLKQQDSSNATSTTLINEKDGRVKHLLKRAYLKHWLRGIDIPVLKASAHVDRDDISSTPSKPSDAMDFARLKVENASLQESMANMEHLTTSIHRLRLSLLKAKEDANISAPGEAALEAIDGIINEAQHIKTALGSSLPVSWSAESGVDAHVSSESEIEPENTEDRMNSGLDSVSAAGFELVELLILAAKLQKIELTARMIISNDS
eukprot:Gb_32602 [translate_table: standard]